MDWCYCISDERKWVKNNQTIKSLNKNIIKQHELRIQISQRHILHQLKIKCEDNSVIRFGQKETDPLNVIKRQSVHIKGHIRNLHTRPQLHDRRGLLLEWSVSQGQLKVLSFTKQQQGEPILSLVRACKLRWALRDHGIKRLGLILRLG